MRCGTVSTAAHEGIATMKQYLLLIFVAILAVVSGCASGPKSGSPEWHALHAQKAAEVMANCPAGYKCSYTYTYGDVSNTYGDLDSWGEVSPSKSFSLSPGTTNDAYGPGINADSTGRPYTWQPTLGHTGGVLGPVTPNAYGPGIGMDATGKPVQAVPQN